MTTPQGFSPHEPRIHPVHSHVDGRRALLRYFNSQEKVGQVYMVEIRPGVTTAWHGHDHQSDYWTVLDGVLQVGVMPFVTHPATDTEMILGLKQFWLSASVPQVLEIPPHWWHGYHNAGPSTVRLLNLTTEPYTQENPDEKRLPPFIIPDFWGKVPAQ